MTSIARLPSQSPDDECCGICGDDNIVIVIKGKANCHMCGNQINLCSKCYYKMQDEIKEALK
jgi:hypothetical protein